MMGCTRNTAPADEDLPPTRITYRPCGAPVVADVSWRGGSASMCLAHCHEAERDGLEQ